RAHGRAVGARGDGANGQGHPGGRLRASGARVGSRLVPERHELSPVRHRALLPLLSHHEPERDGADAPVQLERVDLREPVHARRDRGPRARSRPVPDGSLPRRASDLLAVRRQPAASGERGGRQPGGPRLGQHRAVLRLSGRDQQRHDVTRADAGRRHLDDRPDRHQRRLRDDDRSGSATESMIQVTRWETGMHTRRRLLGRLLGGLLGNERGVALPLAMILLMVLTLLTITFMSLGAVEPQISRNLSDAAVARQLAESGVEWGLTQLRAQDFTTLLSTATTGTLCGSGVVCRVLGTGQTLPGLTSSQGTFTVTLRNDYLANDDLLTGLATETQSTADGSGAGSVPNGVVILTSTRTLNGASRTITAVVQRRNLPVHAALTLTGVQTDTYTDAPPCSGCYSIDGRNWSLTDTSTQTGSPSAPKLGIATYTGNEGTYTYEQNAE